MFYITNLACNMSDFTRVRDGWLCNCVNIQSDMQKQVCISVPLHSSLRRCRSHCNSSERLKIKRAGHSCLFLLCQRPWKQRKMLAGLWFAAHPKNLLLCDWPDWCWYFCYRLLTALCYLRCLWFDLAIGRWRLRNWLEHWGSVYSGPDFWWLSRFTKAALIHSSDLQSYRCPPDAAGSLYCPLHVIQQRCNIYFGAKSWDCFHGVRIKCNFEHVGLLSSFDDASVTESGLRAMWLIPVV